MPALSLVGLQQRHPVKFHAMINETVSQPCRNARLQFLDFRIMEFDDSATFDIDKMIVVIVLHGFIARTTTLELVALDDPGFFEQFDGAVDRGDGDARIDLGDAAMQRFDIGVIINGPEHPRDHPALFGNAQAFFEAERFKIDFSAHAETLLPPTFK